MYLSTNKVNSLQEHRFFYSDPEQRYLISVQSENKCSPKLELLNCGSSTTDMPSISPYKSAMILSNVEVDASCKDLETVSMNWDVWLVTSSSNYRKSVKILEFDDKQNYFVAQGSLYYGVYMVTLQSNAIFSDQILYANTSCYFEVRRLPLQTVIVGGSKRHKYFKSPVTFDIVTLVAPDVCVSNHVIGKIPPLNVIYEWTCDGQDYFCSPFKSTRPFREIIGPFTQFKEYNFSLRVQSIEQFYGYEFQVITMDSTYELELSLECIVNCGGSAFKSNPQEIILLEAKLSTDFKEKNASTNYFWNYNIVGLVEKTEDVAEIREEDSAKNVFIVKRNKLKENKKYIFTVSYGNSSNAELVVETCLLPKMPSCTIFPDKGIRGDTYFNINCSATTQEGDYLTITFEFFDRYINEDLGRYLGLSTTGILKKVILTRDRLFVRAINLFGAFLETGINVQLSPFPQHRSDSNLKLDNHLLGNYIYRIGLITANVDYINSQTFSTNLTTLLTMLKREETYIEEITGATLLISALHNIFYNASNKTQYLESKTLRAIAKMMYHASQIVKDTVTDPFKSSVCTTRILEISNYIINCSSGLLVSISSDSYNLLDSMIHQDLKIGAFYIMESLNNVLTAVAFKALISLSQIRLNSKYIEVVLLNIGPNLENITYSSEVSQRFLNVTKSCLKRFPEFQIQILVFKKMPFWWAIRPGGEINTNIFDLKHKHGADYILIDETTEDSFKIDLEVVDFEPLVIFGSVKQPNPENSPDVNDFVVAVHRVNPVVNSKTFVKFTGIKGNTTLRAILLQDQRPDFDYMNSNSIVLTNKSSSLNLTMTKSNNNLFLYLGILPGEDVQIGETINYTFELFTASCKVRKYESWMMGSKCKVTDVTYRTQISCACSMLTLTLGGQMFVPPNDFNPFSDIRLLVSATDYPFAIIFTVIVVILYVFMLLWTCRKDKRNKMKVNVVVLDDNNERDTYGYLVGVFTGSRIRAGTTSNVGIMLLGEEGMSRSHILKSKLRPTLQANSDDWFLIYTRHHLGLLTNIIVSIDYSGSRPNWYCSKIFVCDLKKYETDTFYCETWFGISIHEIYLKMVKECATYKEINNVNRIISENVEYGFRENHLWLSLFIGHPRSLVSSSQRLTAAFCSLFVKIAASALMYFLTFSPMEDLAHYTISKETFTYGIVSGLVGSLFSFITFHFFQTSYKLVPSPTGYHEHLDGATMYHLERQTTVTLEDPLWLKKIKKVIRYVKPCQVIPLQKNEDNWVGVEKSVGKKFFAFIFCSVISILSIHLTVTCGIHLGEIKSLLWLTSLVIAIIQTVCVTLPVKILAISLLIAVSKTRYFPLTSHIIGRNQTVGGSFRRKTNEEFSEHLTRREPLLSSYHPLHLYSEEDLQRKQARTMLLWTSVYTFGCLLFIAIVSWLILSFNLNEFYIINTTVCREIDTQEACQYSHYSRFDNYNQFLDKIEKEILPVLYSRFWYNGASKNLPTESFPGSGWLGDGYSRLIGPPRLRQIRVKKVHYCKTPRLMTDNSSHCFVRLNELTEDTGNYNTGWAVDDWVDCEFDQASWHFLDEKQAMGAGIRTQTGLVCHGGGYVLFLRGSEDKAKLVIRNIKDTKWIDKYTRVLMLEFTAYNLNNNVFTFFTVFAEATPFDLVVSNQIVQSVKLSYLPIGGIVFLVNFFAFFLRVLTLMSIMGIRKFLKNLWNFQEIIILVSYFVSVIYYSHTSIQKEKYREHIHTQGKDVYFQVQILTSEINIMKDTISVLFCLVAFRLLRIIRFNADVRQYLHDLYSAIQGIVWIWVVLSLFIFVQWRLVMFLVVSPPGDSFKDLLVYQSDFKIAIYQYRDTHGKILAFLISLLTQVGMFSYVCSLTHFYKKGQLKRNPPPADADINQKKHSRYSRLWDSSYD